MFGRKLKHPKEDRHAPDEQREPRDDADSLVKKTLDTLDQSLAVKREAREKTARFVGSLRPLAAKR